MGIVRTLKAMFSDDIEGTTMKVFRGEVIQINSETGKYDKKGMDPVTLIKVLNFDVRRANASRDEKSIVRLHCTDSRLKLKGGIKIGDIVRGECLVFDEQLIDDVEQSLLVSIEKMNTTSIKV